MPKAPFLLGIAAAALSVAFSTASVADETEIKAKAEDYTKTEVAKWVADADVVAALNAANAANTGYNQGKIDELDKQWRAEVGAAARPLIDQVMGSKASTKAKTWCAGAGGVVTEVILMDNKGLNVGICDVSSDYWQGDEAKYANTFTKGAGTIFVDDVEQDSSTQKFQVQASMTVVDPASGQPIGVVTVGLDAESLMTQ